MKTLLIILFFSIKSFSQDSVMLKVLWSKKIGDTVFYTFRILETGEKVVSKCCCERKKSGELVRIAKRDLVFIKNDL